MACELWKEVADREWKNPYHLTDI